jgi:hypothetical protein
MNLRLAPEHIYHVLVDTERTPYTSKIPFLLALSAKNFAMVQPQSTGEVIMDNFYINRVKG